MTSRAILNGWPLGAGNFATYTPTPTPPPLPNLNGVVPSYGLVSATADGSTGQTYTLNASWTNVQWYRMKLASPVSFTAIPGATGTTYVSQAADEGYRLAVAGVESGANRAAKSYHVVLPPPVILEDFENLADWTAANGADVQIATDSPAYGTKRLQVTSTGTSGATATKNNIGSFDTSLLGTIAVLGDVGFDAGRQTGEMSVVLKRFGALQAGPTFGTLYETPSPLLMGKLWGAMHVSDNAALNSPGGGTVGVVVGPTGDIPHSKVTKFDALLGKAGGRATIAIVFDDLKITQYSFAYPLMKSLGIPGGINFVGTTSSNSSAFDMPKIREVYADGWDVNLDSTFNDNITSSFGTLAAAGASPQQNKDLTAANGLTRGNEHGCWTGGQIESNPPSARVFVASVTSTGTNVVTMASTSGIVAGMRAIGHNVPNSPITTVVSVDSATQVTDSAN